MDIGNLLSSSPFFLPLPAFLSSDSMSGLEVLGALAGAVQLIEACVKIMSGLRRVRKLVKGGPNLFEQQLDQTTQLMRIAELIEASRISQHGNIFNPLMAVIVETDQLQKLLADIISTAASWRVGKLYLGAIMNSTRESKLRRAFATLEEKKSALTLCTLSTCGELILEVRNEISEQLPRIHKSISDIESCFQQYPDILSEIRTVQNQLLQCRCMALPEDSFQEKSQISCHSFENDSTFFESYDPTSHHLISTSPGTYEGEKAHSLSTADKPLRMSVIPSIQPIISAERPMQCDFALPEPSPRSPDARSAGSSHPQSPQRYHRVCATESARQINGDIGCGAAFPDSNVHYEQVIAMGNSRQVNGNIFDPSFAKAFFSD
ncbi:hypothetical protein K469DRAFT_319133 [Zopfia rhizophila CBS 207.26]|uniref:Uncharacterized protein n=1 Tax=Zopfia rhizophila CBS 207.26 TaxID=1314779 RepID=A0A6A6EQ01_9PEZI|nr:hypothetical protein K469DRAFT_319133 [Zopfia rhizophila CBS 207.26]